MENNCQYEKNKLSGISKLIFGFEKFNMDLPRVAIVLSVENNIRLELEFSAEISKHSDGEKFCVTDTWSPQVNGVVNTWKNLIKISKENNFIRGNTPISFFNITWNLL